MAAQRTVVPLALAALALALAACGGGGGGEATAAAEEPATTAAAKTAKAAPAADRVAKLERRVKKLETRVAVLAKARAAEVRAPAAAEAPAAEPPAEPAPATTAAATVEQAPEGPHWTYAGEEGPAHWGGIDPSFEACEAGKHQSPIDLGSATGGTAGALSLEWKAGSGLLRNTGHSVQVDLEGAGGVMLDGSDYPLVQFHAHTPSEHTYRGKRYPLELHFVHKDAKDRLVVVGVLVEEGPVANAALAALGEHLPAKGEAPVALASFDPRALLPTALVRTVYRYDGSLTTPPCSEGVAWNVLNGTMTMSAEQIAAFAAALPEPENARPVQPLGDRKIAVAVATG